MQYFLIFNKINIFHKQARTAAKLEDFSQTQSAPLRLSVACALMHGVDLRTYLHFLYTAEVATCLPWYASIDGKRYRYPLVLLLFLLLFLLLLLLLLLIIVIIIVIIIVFIIVIGIIFLNHLRAPICAFYTPPRSLRLNKILAYDVILSLL